jgi:thiol-disulfide isomerase/thioredoxin
MKKILSSLLALPLLIGLAYGAEPQKPIEITTIEGKKIHIVGTENGLSIPEYKGKVVFLEFWGTHCPPCLVSIPHYVDMIAKYKGKLEMLAVEVQGTPQDRLKTFAASKGMNYDVVPYKNAGYFVEYIARRAGWKGSIPFLMILDQNGTVVTMQVGMLPQNVLEKVVNDLLSKKAHPQKAPTKAPQTSPAPHKAKPAA